MHSVDEHTHPLTMHSQHYPKLGTYMFLYSTRVLREFFWSFACLFWGPERTDIVKYKPRLDVHMLQVSSINRSWTFICSSVRIWTSFAHHEYWQYNYSPSYANVCLIIPPSNHLRSYQDIYRFSPRVSSLWLLLPLPSLLPHMDLPLLPLSSPLPFLRPPTLPFSYQVLLILVHMFHSRILSQLGERLWASLFIISANSESYHSQQSQAA